MKKIIGIIFISLMFCNIGFAEMRVIEDKFVKGNDSFYVGTLCVDGYKFVIAEHRGGTSIVQFYEAGNNQSPKPAKC